MKIKVGDRVRCIPGFNGSNRFLRNFRSDYGGYGYKEDLMFIVERITAHPTGSILWGKTAFYGGGVYDRAVVKIEDFTPFPIVKKHYFLDSLK